MEDQELKMNAVRYDNADALLVGTQDLPGEQLYADIEGQDPAENVTLDVWRGWGGGGGCQWCGCYISAPRGSANGSLYSVLKGDEVLEEYETMAAANKSRYKAFFKVLAKMAEEKHKERKILRRYRLFQVKSLEKNEAVLSNGKKCCDVLAGAIDGDIESVLLLASAYENGIRSCKLPKRPKESFGWYLRGAVCGSREAMQKVVDVLRSGTAEVSDPALAEYWEKKLARMDEVVCGS